MSMGNDRLVETFLALAEIPSPAKRERAVADAVTRQLLELGYAPEEDDAGRALGGDANNLRVRVPGKGKGPRLLLAAHLDTVEDGEAPLEPRVEGDWIVGDGRRIMGADDKTGVAVLLEVLARLKEEPVHHAPLSVVFTVAEEIECRGATELPDAWLADADAGIALDYSSPMDIVVAAPTKVTLRIRVLGVSGHAGFPEPTLNAAHILARAVARLPQGRLDELTTANVGILRAGTAVNIIPGVAEAEYEIRSHRKDVLDFHLKRILGILEGAVREARIFPLTSTGGLAPAPTERRTRASGRQSARMNPPPPVTASVDVEVEVCYEGYQLAADCPPVAVLRQAVLTATGMDARLVSAQGGSDANILNRRGLPSAVIGCGMYGAHGNREKASIPEMRQTVETLLHAVRED